MNEKKSAGVFFAILGLLFIIFPILSSELVSTIVGFGLLFFGISGIYTGLKMKEDITSIYAPATMIFGLIITILGFIFIFYIDSLSFLSGLQFYIVGFVMIIFGIGGLFSKMGPFSVFTGILVSVMGIIAIALAAFTVSPPIYIAVIIGIVLIIEGISLMLED